MKVFTFLGIVMIICGAGMLWSVSGASDETRLFLGLFAGVGQIGVGIAWIILRDRMGISKK
jgi:hypothetical protein